MTDGRDPPAPAGRGRSTRDRRPRDLGDDRRVVARPVELLGPAPRGGGHLGPERGVGAQPLHRRGQRLDGGRARRSIPRPRRCATDPAVGVTMLGRPQARASYVTTADPSNSDGNDEHVGRRHPRRHLGMPDPPEVLDLAEIRLQRPSPMRQRPEELQRPPRPPDQPPRLQQVLDPFPLRDPARKEEGAAVGVMHLPPGPAGSGACRRHTARRRPARPASRAGPARRGCAPTARAPGRPARRPRSRRWWSQSSAPEVELAVPQVDREEIGRPLGLGRWRICLLLADVAVDHAQDGRDAEPPRHPATPAPTRRR